MTDLVDELLSKDDSLSSFYSYTTEDLNKIYKDQHGGCWFPYGIPTLDAALEGVGRGELITLTAPTGVGKSTVAQSIAWNAINIGVSVLYYSLEMPITQLLLPFLRHDPENGNGIVLNKTKVDRLDKTSSYPLYLPRDMGKMKFSDVKAMINVACYTHSIGLVVIDHLHYLLQLKDQTGSKENLSTVLGDMVRDLKRLSLETNIPIILIAHTTKTNDGKRVTLNDIRDSSFIAQESDVVISMWREILEEPQIKIVDGFQLQDEMSIFTEFSIEKSRRTGQRAVGTFSFDNGFYHEATLEEKKHFYGMHPIRKSKKRKYDG